MTRGVYKRFVIAVSTLESLMTESQLLDILNATLHRADTDGSASNVTLEASSELAELGLDSLLMMDWIGALETRFGLRFSDTAIARVRTVRDLSNLIRSHVTASAA
jgi:acyl carrier protein